jgi:hypothetical protein
MSATPSTKLRAGLAEVFHIFGVEYLDAHGLTAPQAKVVRAVLDCRTAALGGHCLECDECSHRDYVYHSCRNRHFPTCQTTTAGCTTRSWRAWRQPCPSSPAIRAGWGRNQRSPWCCIPGPRICAAISMSMCSSPARRTRRAGQLGRTETQSAFSVSGSCLVTGIPGQVPGCPGCRSPGRQAAARPDHHSRSVGRTAPPLAAARLGGLRQDPSRWTR